MERDPHPSLEVIKSAEIICIGRVRGHGGHLRASGSTGEAGAASSVVAPSIVARCSSRAAEARRPPLPVRRQPPLHLAQRLRTDPVDAALGVDRGTRTSPAWRKTRRCLDTAGWLMPSDVDEVSHGSLLSQQQIEDQAPVRFGEHLERRHHPLNMP